MYSTTIFCCTDLAPNLQKWWNEGATTYLLLKAGTDIEKFNTKIADFVKTYNKETIFTLAVRPYSSSYLYGHYENGVQAGGRIEYVKLFLTGCNFYTCYCLHQFHEPINSKGFKKIKRSRY